MIDVFEALSWLNEFDVSHLSPAAEALVVLSHNVSQTDAQLRTMIRNLEAIANVSRDPLEDTEITLHRAALQYWRRAYPQAIKLARKSLKGLHNDPHREAIAHWILGMALWRRMENDPAYTHWDNARNCFRAALKDSDNRSSNRNWYEERLMKMEIELVCKPEEILHWLNEFEPTNLTEPSVQLVHLIHERIRQRSYPDAFAMLQDLQEVNRWSKDLYERAETYLECAFFSYQMGDLSAAVELLRHAVVDFFPGAGSNHKHVIARCMLGAIEWMDETTRNNANADWMRCIAQMEELRLKADRDNDQNRKKWYADRRTFLRRALMDRLPSAGPPHRNQGPTASAPPQPEPVAPSGPNGRTDSTSREAATIAAQESHQTVTAVAEPEHGQADRYIELLNMVGHDAQVAERLIELARRSAPSAARHELIERAIERLLRDRQ